MMCGLTGMRQGAALASKGVQVLPVRMVNAVAHRARRRAEHISIGGPAGFSDCGTGACQYSPLQKGVILVLLACRHQVPAFSGEKYNHLGQRR